MYIFSFRNMQDDLNGVYPLISELPVGWDDPILKEQIVQYMAYKGHMVSWNTRRGAKDLFDGHEIPVSGNAWHDKYGNHWTDEHTYYVDVYDLKVPDKFIRDVKRAYQEGFSPEEDKLCLPWRQMDTRRKTTIMGENPSQSAKTEKGEKSMSHVIVYRIVPAYEDESWAYQRYSYAKNNGFTDNAYEPIFDDYVPNFDVHYVSDINDINGFDAPLNTGDIIEVDGQRYYVDPAWLVVLDD